MWSRRQAQVSVSQRHILEKNKNQTKKISGHTGAPASPKVDLGKHNCPMRSVYGVVSRVRRVNRIQLTTRLKKLQKFILRHH